MNDFSTISIVISSFLGTGLAKKKRLQEAKAAQNAKESNLRGGPALGAFRTMKRR